MKKVVRLTESELSNLIKRVVKEQQSTEACRKEDQMPSPTRPMCSSFEMAKSVGGKMIPVSGDVFMMVMDKGCPKLCKVGKDEMYKLS